MHYATQGDWSVTLNKLSFSLKLGVGLLIFISGSIKIAAAVEITSHTNSSEPVIVAFTRHTFRGPNKITPPPIPRVSNLKVQNNILAYGMDATILGLKIAQRLGREAYNDGARLALKTINADPQLAGHWSEIRPDLSTQRTFWTAVCLRKGLATASGSEIPMSACPTTEGVAIDAVSASSKSQMQCIPSQLIIQQRDLLRTQVAPRYVQLANRLISLLGGKPDVTQANPYTSYSDIKLLSSLIEYSSDFNGSTLNRVLAHPITTSPQVNREAVAIALDILGYNLLFSSSGLSADITAFAKINYVNSLSNGSQKIILTHDDKISALLQSLNLLSSQSDPDDLAVYPLETITIALNANRVAIVRTRINIDKNGSMTGKSGFKSWIFWSGTRKEWDERVTTLQARINSYMPVAACLQKITPCSPVPLQLMLGETC